MNQIKILQQDWVNICARLEAALKDSERLDFILSMPQPPFKDRRQIDEAKKIKKY